MTEEKMITAAKKLLRSQIDFCCTTESSLCQGLTSMPETKAVAMLAKYIITILQHLYE